LRDGALKISQADETPAETKKETANKKQKIKKQIQNISELTFRMNQFIPWT
jgi:hypothetical protein